MSFNHRLEQVKETLLCAIEMEMYNLEEVDTKELGEAIDMIKDLEEAIYYCTITSAMNNPTSHYRNEDEKDNDNDDDENNPIYSGRSYKSRKMYMKTKETHQDKAAQMRELEKYMQELTQDMLDMIEDASPEEKQYLSKRVTSLANKLAQLNA